jgi:hypothetical protein
MSKKRKGGSGGGLSLTGYVVRRASGLTINRESTRRMTALEPIVQVCAFVRVRVGTVYFPSNTVRAGSPEKPIE